MSGTNKLIRNNSFWLITKCGTSFKNTHNPSAMKIIDFSNEQLKRTLMNRNKKTLPWNNNSSNNYNNYRWFNSNREEKEERDKDKDIIIKTKSNLQTDESVLNIIKPKYYYKKCIINEKSNSKNEANAKDDRNKEKENNQSKNNENNDDSIDNAKNVIIRIKNLKMAKKEACTNTQDITEISSDAHNNNNNNSTIIIRHEKQKTNSFTQRVNPIQNFDKTMCFFCPLNRSANGSGKKAEVFSKWEKSLNNKSDFLNLTKSSNFRKRANQTMAQWKEVNSKGTSTINSSRLSTSQISQFPPPKVFMKEINSNSINMNNTNKKFMRFNNIKYQLNDNLDYNPKRSMHKHWSLSELIKQYSNRNKRKLDKNNSIYSGSMCGKCKEFNRIDKVFLHKSLPKLGKHDEYPSKNGNQSEFTRDTERVKIPRKISLALVR